MKMMIMVHTCAHHMIWPNILLKLMFFPLCEKLNYVHKTYKEIPNNVILFCSYLNDCGSFFPIWSWRWHNSLFCFFYFSYVPVFWENLFLSMLTNCSLIKDIFSQQVGLFCTILSSSHSAVKKAPILLNCQRFLINKIRVSLSNYCNIAVFLNEISLFQTPFFSSFYNCMSWKKWLLLPFFACFYEKNSYFQK